MYGCVAWKDRIGSSQIKYEKTINKKETKESIISDVMAHAQKKTSLQSPVSPNVHNYGIHLNFSDSQNVLAKENKKKRLEKLDEFI